MPQITFEELNSVWTLKKELDREKRRLFDLESLLSSTTVYLDGMPHAKPLESKIELFTEQIIDCKNRIGELCEEYIQRKFELLCRINAFKLPELQNRILCYHFVSCMKLSEVAKFLNFTRRYIEILLHKALVYLFALLSLLVSIEFIICL